MTRDLSRHHHLPSSSLARSQRMESNSCIFAPGNVRSLTPALRTASYLEHYQEPGATRQRIHSPYHFNLPSTLSASILAPCFKCYCFIPPCLVPPAPSTPWSHFALHRAPHLRAFPPLTLIFGIAISYFLCFSFFSSSEVCYNVAIPGVLAGDLYEERCVWKQKKDDGAEIDMLICKFSSDLKSSNATFVNGEQLNSQGHESELFEL